MDERFCLGDDLHAGHVAVEVRGVGVCLGCLGEAGHEVLDLLVSRECHFAETVLMSRDSCQVKLGVVRDDPARDPLLYRILDTRVLSTDPLQLVITRDATLPTFTPDSPPDAGYGKPCKHLSPLRLKLVFTCRYLRLETPALVPNTPMVTKPVTHSLQPHLPLQETPISRP